MCLCEAISWRVSSLAWTIHRIIIASTFRPATNVNVAFNAATNECKIRDLLYNMEQQQPDIYNSSYFSFFFEPPFFFFFFMSLMLFWTVSRASLNSASLIRS